MQAHHASPFRATPIRAPAKRAGRVGGVAYAHAGFVPTAAICASLGMYAALTLGGSFVFARDPRAG